MIHIFPGMGATSSMYGDIWRKEIPGVFHDWPEWHGETTITELAERIVIEDGIEDGDVLVGSSLGGIVACEIARIRNIDLVVLIGSAANKEEISRILEILHPLADYSPIGFIKACSGKLPSDLAKMFSDSDPGFIRAMSKAIFKWEGVHPSTRLLRIHGSRDLVIPPPDKADLLISGGHLIAMTHPNECIQKLKVEQVAAGNVP